MPARDDPPRVSLILLAYRQERFVTEAVMGAFGQDYPNLEIVLSDHGSDDATYAIMADLAEAYPGPHRLLLNRSDSPGAILGHFRDAVSKASGDLIVMAAGDDVSLPHRVSRLAERWRATGAAQIHSAAQAIDEAGRPLGRVAQGPRLHDAADYFPGGAVRHVHGATAAYDRRALEAVPEPPFTVFTEDLFLTLMLGIGGGRQEWIDEPLVRFRVHPGGYSATAGAAGSLDASERAMAERSRQTASIFRYAAARARESGAAPGLVDAARLEADAAFHEAAAEWQRLPLPKRLAALLRARRRGQRRWMLPRLFGLKGLAAAKRLRLLRAPRRPHKAAP